MHQALAVNKLERRQHRNERAAHFFGHERALGNNLREVLLGKLLDRIHQFAAVDGGASHR